MGANFFTPQITDLVVTEYEVMAASIDGTVRNYDLRNSSCTVDHICQPLTSFRLTNDGTSPCMVRFV